MPQGTPASGLHCGLEGRLLEIELTSGTDISCFPAGSLIEVGSPTTLYLGEVYVSDGRRRVIGVEHLIDRESLAAIQDLWSSRNRS